MSDRRIPEIAVSYSGSITAIGHSDGSVTTWNLSTNSEVCHFESHFETGGRRLAISNDGAMCAVGAYDGYGISMHDTVDGKMIWQRKDLQKVQTLTFGNQHSGALIACFDSKPCHILNATTGETISTLRGVRRFYRCYVNGRQLRVGARDFKLFNRDQKRSLGSVKVKSFAVLDAVFTERSVVVAEPAGPTRCFDCTDLGLKWEYAPKPGMHILALGYRRDTQEVLGVCWGYMVGGDATLLAFDENTGEINSKNVLRGFGGACFFALQGKWLIHNTGLMIDTSDSKRTRKLFPDRVVEDEHEL
jgi:hypothetical protein